ncbi:DUF3592 domain-containing protein [Halomonas sp. V046]|uniref:DUF3592 domain-containing protein n=1 Tax=Halomonas sp. V046 TaxID=3459611 RepID=UPI00404495E9
MPHPLLLVAVAALIGAIIAAIGAWQVRDVNAWPHAEATVTAAQVSLLEAQRHQREQDNQPRRYAAHVSLRAIIDGVTIDSDNAAFDGVPSFPTHAQAEAYLAKYPVGSNVRVWVSPRDSRIMSLGDQPLPWGRIGLAGFLALASIGAMGVYLAKS